MDRPFASLIGVAAPLLGVITSMQDELEWALRITSLVIGIAIGLISLYRLLRKLKV